MPLAETSPQPASALFETIQCPLCEQTAYDIVKPFKHPPQVSLEDLQRAYSASSSHVLLDQVVRCRSCGLEYVNPRPKSEVIVESYSAAEDETFVAQNPGRIRTFERFQRKALAKQGWTSGAGKRYLDIGCAGGASLVAARTVGFEASGVEPSRWMANYGRKTYGVDIRDGILEPGMFPPSSFDMITMWDVLEHVPSPKQVLDLVHTLLRPGGLFVLTYPDIGSTMAKLLGDRWPFWLSVHLLYYTPETMKKQLERSNFRPLEFSPYWQTLELGYVFQRAAPYVPVLGFMPGLLQTVGLGKLPFTYNMGQTFVWAKRAGD